MKPLVSEPSLAPGQKEMLGVLRRDKENHAPGEGEKNSSAQNYGERPII